MSNFALIAIVSALVSIAYSNNPVFRAVFVILAFVAVILGFLKL